MSEEVEELRRELRKELEHIKDVLSLKREVQALRAEKRLQEKFQELQERVELLEEEVKDLRAIQPVPAPQVPIQVPPLRGSDPDHTYSPWPDNTGIMFTDSTGILPTYDNYWTIAIGPNEPL